MKPAPRLFGQAQWMLLGLALCLAMSFWLASRQLVKPVEDTYSDPRRMQALQTFEQAVVVAKPGTPDSAFTLEDLHAKFPCAVPDALNRLMARLQAIRAKLRRVAQGSGKDLRLSLEHWPPPGSECRDVLEAAKWLGDNQAQRLDLMEWPVFRKPRYATPMRVPPSVFLQDNPWRGVDGCVYLGPDAEGRWFYVEEQRGQRQTCPDMAPPAYPKDKLAGLAPPKDEAARRALRETDPAWSLPDSLGAMLAELGRVRRPQGDTYARYTEQPPEEGEAPPGESRPHGPNRLVVGKREVDVGFSVQLTLDPAKQRLAQQWARCYTGDVHACELLKLDRRDPLAQLSEQMYESAAVRMAAVALIDVASGRIEALGSAHTACYAQDHDGPGHDDACPDAPFRPRYDSDRLLNHAVYGDAMPASTVKPVLALGFLMDTTAFRSGKPLTDLQHDLKVSNSPNFLDRLFCGRELAGQRPWQWRECQRLQRAQEAARLLGWNQGCGPEAFSPDCAELDLLFGRPADQRTHPGIQQQPMGLTMLYGRLLVEPYREAAAASNPAGPDDWDALLDGGPSGGARLVNEFRFDESFAKECSAGRFCPECDDKQHGRWRHCKGVGGPLTNEGWGQGEARATPVGVAGMIARLAAAANGAKQQAYPHLVAEVSDSHGQPFELAAQRLAGPAPVEADPALAALVLQGMTSHQKEGTAHEDCKHVFGAQRCEAIDWIAGKTGTPPFGFNKRGLRDIAKDCAPGRAASKGYACNEIPYKWYVAAFKTQGGSYDQAIAVLTERNWFYRKDGTGTVHAPDDKVNPSAELAFRVIKALRREPEPPPPGPATPKPKPKSAGPRP